MKLVWKVEPQEVEQTRAFYQVYEDDPFVLELPVQKRAEDKARLSRAKLWPLPYKTPSAIGTPVTSFSVRVDCDTRSLPMFAE
jgi:hypothetical protein